ncbi:M48 family metallopeptidase [Streptomyces sp. NPDC048603]|uniref:M48 family metallopeptidase n=1 Tax=Streptomyces sp. NPDC048603 TaxID=3365577 RepID=UPI003723A604
MLEDRRTGPGGTGRAGVATVAAYVVAGAVHLLTAGLLLSGVLLIVLGFTTVVRPLLGLPLVIMALVLRPRLRRLDPDLPTLRRADAPALFELLDRIADAVGVRRPDTVQLTAECAAAVFTHGFLRRRCLALGVPLWATHSPRQRVAVLARAMADLDPGNVRRGAFVGMALRSLTAGADLMRPPGRAVVPANGMSDARHAADVMEGARRFNARTRAGTWALWLPGAAATGTVRLLLWLTGPATRRAALAADDASARAASTEAVIAALRDRSLARAVVVETHRLAVEARTVVRDRSATARPEEVLWDRVARHTAGLRERRAGAPPDRPGAQDTPCEAAPWPSEAQRIKRLAGTPHHPAAITVDGPGRTRIEAELRPSAIAVARRVMRDGVPLAYEPASVHRRYQ